MPSTTMEPLPCESSRPPRNPWPLGVVAAFGLFIAGILGLIVLAASQRMELVTANYYEEELHYQAQIDRTRRTRALTGGIEVVYRAEQQEIRLSLPREQARLSPRGQIHLYRPSGAKLDLRLPLALDTNGVQIVRAGDLRPGLWKVRLEWTAEGQDYFTEAKVTVTKAVPEK